MARKMNSKYVSWKKMSSIQIISYENINMEVGPENVH